MILCDAVGDRLEKHRLAPNVLDEALGETKTGPDGQFVFRNGIAVETMVKVQARGYISHNAGTIAGGETMAPANPTGTSSPLALPGSGIRPAEILLGLALLSLLAGIYVLFKGYGWKNILKERSFDLMLLLFTFVLPMLSAFLLDIFKATLNVTIPTDAASVNGLDARALGIIGAILILLFILSIAIGMF